jgi:hypothetical protein
MALTAPLVPTGIKIGVGISPWAVWISPVRAELLGSVASILKKSVIYVYAVGKSGFLGFPVFRFSGAPFSWRSFLSCSKIESIIKNSNKNSNKAAWPAPIFLDSASILLD